MRRFFEPASAPIWLRQVLSSIRAALGDVYDVPLRLFQVATADRPTAADYKSGLIYDTTDSRPAFSDGASWFELQPYDADVAALAALATTGLIVRTGAGTMAARTLQAPAAGLSITNPAGIAGDPTFALTNDLAALEALSGTSTIYYRSAADTWTAVTIGGNLGFSAGTLGSSLGTAATKATGTSGNTVPLLDGANAWSADNTFITQSAGDNSTKTATTAYARAAAPNPSYRVILDSSGSHIAGKTAATYAIGQGDPLAVSGTGTLYPVNLITIAAADYPSVDGLAAKLRVRAVCSVNDTAPTGTYTVGLHPVTRPASSGGAGVLIYSIGAAVSGSTLVFTTPAADSTTGTAGADFALPADGTYCLAVVQTGTVAASSLLHFSAALQQRNA